MRKVRVSHFNTDAFRHYRDWAYTLCGPARDYLEDRIGYGRWRLVGVPHSHYSSFEFKDDVNPRQVRYFRDKWGMKMKFQGLYTLLVPAHKVGKRDTKITLNPEVIEQVESLVGTVEDRGFWFEDPPADCPDSWGWFLGTDAYYLGFWFKDPKYVPYFKLLWGGE